MKRNLASLVKKEFDILIVGGGIFGACAAWDAALRGLSVALIERQDFCSGASANSLKVMHGGIRYLQHADLRRLRSSCFERSTMLRIAPHLVQPLPITVPTYGYMQRGKPFLGAGMLLYDLLTCDRNRGIKDKARQIPISRFLNRQETLEKFPDINGDGLTGAAVFCDGQIYNPTRLVLAFIQSAVNAGATVANYVEATGFTEKNRSITGVTAKDVLTGDQFDIAAKVTLNATGPWAESLLNRAERNVGISKGTYSRDACFVVRRRFKHQLALAIQGRTRDPGAIVSREARHLFLMPWRDYTLVGVWHIVWNKHPDSVQVEESELQSFIDEINWAYPSLNLTLNDVLMWNAGLVPFGENEADAVDLKYGKESRLVDHRTQSNLDGLITLIGVRYTVGRKDAAGAVDLAMKKLGRKSTPASTNRIPLHGGDIENFDELVEKVSREQQGNFKSDIIQALIHNYGTEYQSVLKLVSENRKLSERLGNTRVLKAEVLNAIRNEMAMSLGDIVFRRTDLATGGHPGEETLNACARLAAEEFGWSPERTQSELEKVMPRLTVRGRISERTNV